MLSGKTGVASEASRAPAHAREEEPRRTLTAAELAARIPCGSRATATLLDQLAEAGLAERAAGAASGWRLTPAAERDFGDALRGLVLDVDYSSRAPRRLKGRSGLVR